LNIRKQEIQLVVENTLNEIAPAVAAAAVPAAGVAGGSFLRSALANTALFAAMSALPIGVEYFMNRGKTGDKNKIDSSSTTSGPGQAGYAINQIEQSALRNYMDSKKF
jgi:hypothetical protein